MVNVSYYSDISKVIRIHNASRSIRRRRRWGGCSGIPSEACSSWKCKVLQIIGGREGSSGGGGPHRAKEWNHHFHECIQKWLLLLYFEKERELVAPVFVGFKDFPYYYYFCFYWYAIQFQGLTVHFLLYWFPFFIGNNNNNNNELYSRPNNNLFVILIFLSKPSARQHQTISPWFGIDIAGLYTKIELINK